MSYTREQLRNVRKVRNTLRRNGATRKEITSAVSTILVESNAQHDRYSQVGSGDRDSVGAFQQRPSQGWGPAGQSIQKDAKQWLAAAKQQRGKGLSAGQLAQAVQRSAFPDRYAERLGDAKQALRQVGGSAGTPSRLTGSIGTIQPGKRPRLVPGGTSVDNSAAFVAAATSGQGGSLLKRWRAQLATGNFTTTTQPEVLKGMGPKYRGGKPVSASVSGKGGAPPTAERGAINELFYNGQGAVNIKDGKAVPKGFVEGHTEHVHLAADRATMKRAAQLARSMGLRVGEYGRGITAGHAPNSYHYRPFGAMDVSGARKAEWAKRVARGDF